jgi:hypothetical protein
MLKPEVPQPQTCAEDAAILPRFAPDDRDLVGLAAYALHRRALHGFRAGFHARHGRAPTAEEEGIFLIGEISEARIAAYRAMAEAIGRGDARKPAAPKRKARWPWFGLWVEAPMAPSGTPETINWRGLLGRLFVLLLAVVVTALMLRVLMVKS